MTATLGAPLLASGRARFAGSRGTVLSPKKIMWRIAVAGPPPDAGPLQQSAQQPLADPPPLQAQQPAASADTFSGWRMPPPPSLPFLLYGSALGLLCAAISHFTRGYIISGASLLVGAVVTGVLGPRLL